MSFALRSFSHSDVAGRALACTFTGRNFLIEHKSGLKQVLTPEQIFEEIIWPLAVDDFEPALLTDTAPPDIGVTILVLHGWMPLMMVNYQREKGLWVDKSEPLDPQVSDVLSARSDILSALSLLIEGYEPSDEETDDAA